MAGIYTRDNIPYSIMIQNAIANRNAAAQRDAAYITNFGNIVGGAVKDMGGVIGRGIAVTEDDDDLAKLRELEAERRLFFVGVTRTQEKLIITYPKNYKEKEILSLFATMTDTDKDKLLDYARFIVDSYKRPDKRRPK